MNVIDVSIVGGPDLAAVTERVASAGGEVLRIAVVNGGPVPARLHRVVVPIETPTVRSVLAPGWDSADAGHDGPLRGADLVGSPGVAADTGAVGWLTAGRHRGDVVVQRDGWLLTARAEMEGVVLSPGERLALDGLWIGPSFEGLAAAWAAEVGAPRPVGGPVGVVVAPGAPGPALSAATREAVSRGARSVLLAARPTDIRAVAAAADRAGLGWGSLCAPFGDPGSPLDVSRPAALDAVVRAAAAVAGAQWVVVAGATAVLHRPRWGAAAATPVASLRRALEALRGALGAAPLLHVAGGPPAALAGAADIVDTAGGGPDAGRAMATRAAFDTTVWAAAPGPLPYGAAREALAGFSGPRVLWPTGAGPAP